jgi:hypothetical protein
MEDPYQLRDYRKCREKELERLSLGDLVKLVGQSNILADFSDTILLVRRPDVDNFRESIVEPITDYVGQLLQRQLMKAERHEQVLSYKKMARTQDSRLWAGRVFEAMATSTWSPWNGEQDQEIRVPGGCIDITTVT